ncbi:MAG: metallophosphoesterase family protein [Candidatus Kapaibacteriales bacterium]
MNPKRFVIGDVHGCILTLIELIEKKIKPKRNDEIIFVGDLIDRGPNPKAVVDYILEMQKKYKVIVVRGNHEQMLLDSLNDDFIFDLWYLNGSSETLFSFQISHPSELQKKYLDFFNSLPYYVSMEDFVVTHGDLNFEADDPFTDTHTMLWGRWLPIKPEKINYRRLVVGHTPTPLELIIKSLAEAKIFIDGGCVYKGNKRKVNLGYLVALELNSLKLLVQPNVDF